ncbi:DUF2971 domain-containing protein [Citrobacter koseri]|uniref:DUF2971 domain-containing protein n=1 Tax=Citrobacter koseri TaxID=545 RepID=UPI000E191890|nr:DUF2971 domain-containing protein [Citrobacter koseri]MBJ8673149.1 DUF2971 domain-containing protein [Citrobacter koseri]MBJ8764701.1 DUF2971 domain-containing protein [Citrobacter koseri]MBJ9232173.1 DUF2971 domain-containing protein [Citrobacter koseri]SUX96578.1 Protein of uncharacterised function (DUF2971) [Citrobacter koseri]HEM6682591.1 DUF2971 domain-containing protein [Citrobacter koseri]
MLYKYRNINEWTISALETQKIWLAKPSTLNDPLECRPPIFNKDEIYNHCAKTWGAQLLGFLHQIIFCKENGEHFFGISGRELDKLFRKINKQNSLEKKIRVANRFKLSVGSQEFADPSITINSIQNHLKNIGVCSLSEDPLSTLLWSHYSAEHRGVALGFEVTPGSKLANKKYCSKVDYIETLPKYSLDDFSRRELTIYAGPRRPENKVLFDDPTIRKILSTKISDWSYEKEWRYFERDSGSYDFPSKLSEIVFGANTKDDEIDKIIQTCHAHIPYDITFKKCFYATNSSSLQLKKIKR